MGTEPFVVGAGWVDVLPDEAAGMQVGPEQVDFLGELQPAMDTATTTTTARARTPKVSVEPPPVHDAPA